MKTRFTPARIVLSVLAAFLFLTAAAFGADRDTIKVFSDGKLAPGITIERGQVKDGMIVTDPITGQSTFAVRGLDIDIASKDLAQVWVKIVATGGNEYQPGYANVEVFTTSGITIPIEWFPFRAYDKNGPKYMTESCARSGGYAEHPEGSHYGKIIGFAIATSAPKGMHITEMEVNIDKTMADRYPDDPVPDPNWKNGKIQDTFAISGSDRVCLQETQSPLKAGNSVWKDGKIVISGARNEIVAFQVVMQSADGTDGVNDVNVVFTGVKNGDVAIDNSKAERSSDPYDYVGRYIQLYRSRYIQYDKNASMEPGPRDMVGKWIPEIQIPFEAKWGGARFSIFPNQTQSVWIDTYIPKEAKPGLYSGQVDVTVAGKTIKSLPVELTVYDFSLPNKPSINAMMWGAPSAAKHGLKEGTPAYQKLEATYRRFFRHNFTEMFKGIGAGVTDEQLADAGEWRLSSGEIYTRKEGYEGPGYELPASVIFITMYGGGLKPFGGPDPYGDEASWHKGLLRYQKIVEKYAPGAMIAWYAWDEPSHGFYGGIEAFKKWMNIVAPWVHSFNEKYHASVKVYSTTDYKVAKEVSALDMYQGTRAQAAEMKKEGDINVHYNGPQGLAYPAAALRIVGWQAFNEDVSLWWMWAWSDYQPAFDEYRDAYNFSNQYGEVGAGIGMFVYPGTDVFIKKRSPGLDGPVPGVRFFNWRQGFIDYEYLAAAYKIDPAATLKIASSIASGARLNQGLPNEAASTGLVTDSERYAAARKALVDIILKGGKDK